MFFGLMVVCPGFAQVPRTMNYQGSLNQAADGNPVNGSVSMTFKLYDALTGGNELWSETHSAVTVDEGIYSVILGTVTPLDILAFDKRYYLELSIGGEVLTPRQPLTSVPYAQRAIRVDGITVKDGKVGIGIAEPTTSLQVVGRIKSHQLETGLLVSRFLQGGTDIGMSIYSNTSAYDSRGFIEFYGAGGALEGALRVGATYIDFRYGSTNQGVGTTGIRLASDGNVGIGTTSPQYALDVNGVIRGNNVSPSDVRFKKNVQQIENALERISQLRGISFQWKSLPIPPPQTDPRVEEDAAHQRRMPDVEDDAPWNRFITQEGRGPRMGLVAQDVERVFPEVVYTDSQGYKSVAYDKLVAPLIEAVKLLHKENNALQVENEALKAKQASFERRLTALEAVIKQP